jgi:hypothetical protein
MTIWKALRRIAIVLLAVLAINAIGRPAEARWHLDLAAGAFSPISDVRLDDDGFDVKIDLDTGAAFSAQGGYAFERWIDLTGGFQTATHFDAFEESVDVYSFTVGCRFFPLPMSSRFRPWLGTQIGWYGVDAHLDDFFGSFDDDIDEFDNSFGLNAGGGFDIPINHRVSLGVDVRYHNAFTAFDGFEYVHTMFNVSIWFGGDPAPVYEPPPAAPGSDADTPPVPRR